MYLIYNEQVNLLLIFLVLLLFFLLNLNMFLMLLLHYVLQVNYDSRVQDHLEIMLVIHLLLNMNLLIFFHFGKNVYLCGLFKNAKTSYSLYYNKMTIKENIINRLRETKRENIENVIDYMEKNGFFEVGCHRHHRYSGGLADHVWQTYQLAMKEELDDKRLHPNVSLLDKDSLAISTLLHFVLIDYDCHDYRLLCYISSFPQSHAP